MTYEARWDKRENCWAGDIFCDGNPFTASIEALKDDGFGRVYIGYINGERKCRAYSLAQCRKAIRTLCKDAVRNAANGSVQKTIRLTWTQNGTKRLATHTGMDGAEKEFNSLIAVAKNPALAIKVSDVRLEVVMSWVPAP